MIRRNLPHFFTLSNLFCGILAIIIALSGDVVIPLYLILAAALFDFVDGWVARMLGVAGPLGKQLDSLADVVTFGVTPGILLYQWGMDHLHGPGTGLDDLLGWNNLALLTPLLIPLFAAVRLARFNIDERQSHGFIGLPTPAATLFLGSWVYLAATRTGSFWEIILSDPFHFSIICLLTGILMVSNVRLFALKFSEYSWKGNSIRYIFLILALAGIVFLGMGGIPIIVLLYLLLSVVQNLIQR
ncbi:MAG: CDP-diacylglycerol--serine O-phosphatidyltransferase [Bacteroidota bacterium]|nr:CDP-diacylglycerol--serine O-phosphatidyltransferase [Bacteroidota bacterium]